MKWAFFQKENEPRTRDLNVLWRRCNWKIGRVAYVLWELIGIGARTTWGEGPIERRKEGGTYWEEGRYILFWVKTSFFLGFIGSQRREVLMTQEIIRTFVWLTIKRTFLAITDYNFCFKPKNSHTLNWHFFIDQVDNLYLHSKFQHQ